MNSIDEGVDCSDLRNWMWCRRIFENLLGPIGNRAQLAGSGGWGDKIYMGWAVWLTLLSVASRDIEEDAREQTDGRFSYFTVKCRVLSWGQIAPASLNSFQQTMSRLRFSFSHQPLWSMSSRRKNMDLFREYINCAKIEFNFFFSRASLPPFCFWFFDGVNIRVGSRTGIPSGECHMSNERFNGSFKMVKQRAKYLLQSSFFSPSFFVWICRTKSDPFIFPFHVSIRHQPLFVFLVDNFQKKLSTQLG